VQNQREVRVSNEVFFYNRCKIHKTTLLENKYLDKYLAAVYVMFYFKGAINSLNDDTDLMED